MKDNAISNLKTLMLLGVVVNHAWAASQYITTPQIPPVHFVSWFSNILVVSGLPVFFFLSGFFAGGKCDKLLSWSGYSDMLRKKACSLAMPYIAWNLLFIVFYLAVGGVIPRIGQRVAGLELDTVNGFLRSLLGIGRKPIDAPLWFVRDLFVIFLISPIIIWMAKRVRWALAGAMVLLMCLGFTYSKWYSFVFFSLGIVAALERLDLRRLARYRWLSMPVCLIASIVLFWYMEHYDVPYPDPRIVIWFYFSALFAWLGMLMWVDFGKTTLFARYVVPASFFIYCSHFLICSTYLHTIAGTIPDAPIKLIVLYGVFIGLGGTTMLVTFHVARRFCPKILSIFVGGRIQ